MSSMMEVSPMPASSRSQSDTPASHLSKRMRDSDDYIDIAVQRMNAIFRKYNLSPQTNITL